MAQIVAKLSVEVRCFYLFITLTNLIINFLNISLYCEITIQICLNLCVSIGIIYFNRDFVLTKKKFPKQNKKLILLLILYFAFILVKLFFSVKVKYIDKTFSLNFSHLDRFLYIIMFLVAGFSEELLFKIGLFQNLYIRELALPWCVIITSTLFFIAHLDLSIYSFIACFIFQIYTLIIYKEYPNVFFLGVLHILNNIPLYI